jgi:hypothetical protein
MPADGQGGDGISNPRPLWKRVCRVDAEIWERDIPGCEGLANHLVAAMHGDGWGEYAMTNAVWNTAGTVQYGVTYTLTFQIFIPFTRESDAVGTIDDFPITASLRQLPLE